MRRQDSRGRVTAQLSGCFPAHRLDAFVRAAPLKDSKRKGFTPVASFSKVKIHSHEHMTILEKIYRVGSQHQSEMCVRGDFIEFRPSRCRNQALVEESAPPNDWHGCFIVLSDVLEGSIQTNILTCGSPLKLHLH